MRNERNGLPTIGGRFCAERVGGDLLPAAEVEPGDGHDLGCLGPQLGVEPVPGALGHDAPCDQLSRVRRSLWSPCAGVLGGICELEQGGGNCAGLAGRDLGARIG